MKRLVHAAALSLALAPMAEAASRAVVVGVDRYASPKITTIDGAVADARDIASALETRGAEVTMLLDEAVTREALIGAFRRAAAASVPGDTLVFSFSGHGVQTPEAISGDEVDGLDENLALQGFGTPSERQSERLRDNDLAALISEVPRGVSVIIVIDTGYSGDLVRRAVIGTTPALRRGAGAFETVRPNSLPRPGNDTIDMDPEDYPGVVLLTAAEGVSGVPELLIDGQPRGALSWAVARAFEGRAAGGDGRTSMEELRLFVRQQVRALSGALQTPEVIYPVSISRSLDGLSGALAGINGVLDGIDIPEPGQTAGGDVFAEELPLTLAPIPTLYAGDAAPAMGAGVDVVADRVGAQLVWDREAGTLLDPRTGDALAEIADGAAAEDAVLKWRAVEGLSRWAPVRAAEMSLDPGDGRHAIGDKIRIVVKRPDKGFDHVLLVNLASGGEVQFVTSARIPPGIAEYAIGPVPVVEPVGADHVIAIVSRQPLSALASQIALLNGRPAPDELLKALRRHAADPDAVRVGLQPMFTTR